MFHTQLGGALDVQTSVSFGSLSLQRLETAGKTARSVVYTCVNVQPWKLHHMQCGQMLRIWLRNRIISHSYGVTSAHFLGRGSVAVCTKLDTPEPIAFEELCILY